MTRIFTIDRYTIYRDNDGYYFIGIYGNKINGSRYSMDYQMVRNQLYMITKR